MRKHTPFQRVQTVASHVYSCHLSTPLPPAPCNHTHSHLLVTTKQLWFEVNPSLRASRLHTCLSVCVMCYLGSKPKPGLFPATVVVAARPGALPGG